MKTNDEIISKVKESIQQDFTILETSQIQNQEISEDKLEAIVVVSNVLYIHVNEMTTLVNSQGKRYTAKIFRLYRQVVQKFAEQTHGYFDIYDIGSFLIIYPGQLSEARIAVKRARQLTYILTESLKEYGKQFNQLDFTIGVDHGRVLGTNEGRFIWYGICINKAKRLSEICLKPYRIGISGTVFKALEDEDKYITTRILNIPRKKEIWERNSYDFLHAHKHYYATRYPEEFDSLDNIV